MPTARCGLPIMDKSATAAAVVIATAVSAITETAATAANKYED